MKSRIAISYSFHDEDWLGGKNYFASLFRAIEIVRPADLSFVLVTGRKIRTSLPKEFPFLEVIRTPLMDRWHPLWLLRQMTLRSMDEDPLLAGFLRRHKIDVLSHSAQLGRAPGLKSIEWLYDFQFMHLPEYWQRRHIRWAEQRYKAACRNCDALIVSSNNALSDLLRFAPWCGVPKHVLHFVSNPIDFARLMSHQELASKYSLPLDYFYLPNQFWSNKNHRLAIDALALVRSRGVDCTIVCTGKTFDGRKSGYFEELMQHCSSVGMKPHFRILGVVPYSDTQSLMAHARAVLNPSRFEGWSTTVEEAKAMHKTLFLSDIPVHREQSPEFGKYFSADNHEELADLMQHHMEVPRPLSVSNEVAHATYRQRLEAFGVAYLAILRSVLSPAGCGVASTNPSSSARSVFKR